MIRVRFHANPDDYRPIKWPITHPYWCSGYGADCSIVVAYAASVDQITELWPEASNIDVLNDNCTEYVFTDRFPKPDWFQLPDNPNV